MTEYRTYRGTHGEPIRVPEATIAPAPYAHDCVTYPFAHIAERAGDKRNRFAQFALKRMWIDDAIEGPFVRAALVDP